MPQVHGFDAYRIFISAPGDLEVDRQACQDAIAHVNAALAMPAKVLLVSLGLREAGHIESNRAIVSDNVRWSSYFIQVFEDDWGPRNLFYKLFQLALECRDDAAMPMQDIVVCLKDAPHERDAEILEFRRELRERADVHLICYRKPEEIGQQLEAILVGWTERIIADNKSKGEPL
ncbi:MAG TPA: hypothetical protein VGJ21_13875 [Terracidiphilus sp.]|jgi:hypothetical protein